MEKTNDEKHSSPLRRGRNEACNQRNFEFLRGRRLPAMYADKRMSLAYRRRKEENNGRKGRGEEKVLSVKLDTGEDRSIWGL